MPDARTHLPKVIERRLLRPYAGSVSGRIGASAVFRALSTLIRKHPKVALQVFGAGVVQAGKSSVGELKGKFGKTGDQASRPGKSKDVP